MEQGMAVPQAEGAAQETRWVVDLEAAGRVAHWARGDGALLAQEVADMGTYFPRWVLTVGNGQVLTRCRHCAEVIVFREGKARCVRCGRVHAAQHAQLAWLGHLPLPVAGLPRALAHIEAHPTPGYSLVQVGGHLLWLVPVIAFYPNDWPRSEPTIRYDPALFRILHIPQPSASHHIVDTNRLCIYGWGQWRAVTMRVVIQQRVVNHLASMAKIGDGQAPQAAFAGNQHTYGGRDEYDNEWNYR